MNLIYFKKVSFYLIIAGLTGMLHACASGEESAGETPVDINGNLVALTAAQAESAGIATGEVETRPVSSVLRLNGRVDVPPQNIISVSIPLGGYLRSTRMLPGMQVSKGQVLALVEDQQYIQLQQDYLVTLSRKVFAAQEQKRQQELNVGHAGSDKALQMAEAEYRSLEISAGALAEKLRLIGINPQTLNEKNISRQIAVRSPINGYISRVNSNIGSYINPSEILFELIDPDDIHLSLTAFEKDLARLAIGQDVIAYTNNDPDKKYKLKVSLISQNLSADRSAEIHCHFEQRSKDLLPGMYMNAEIILTHSAENTLPENSIVSFEGRQYVFIDKGGLNYEMTEVTTGNTEGGFTAVKTNLDNHKIVTQGAYSLLMQLKNVADDE